MKKEKKRTEEELRWREETKKTGREASLFLYFFLDCLARLTRKTDGHHEHHRKEEEEKKKEERRVFYPCEKEEREDSEDLRDHREAAVQV